MQNFGFVVKILRNKYAIAPIAFAAWILFFDRNDVFTQWERKTELEQLEASKAYYESEIATLKKELADLQNNTAVLEKFARENFFLKRPNEDVFIVEETLKKTKTSVQ